MKSKEIYPISFSIKYSEPPASFCYQVPYPRPRLAPGQLISIVSYLCWYKLFVVIFSKQQWNPSLILVKHAKSLMKSSGPFHFYSYGESHLHWTLPFQIITLSVGAKMTNALFLLQIKSFHLDVVKKQRSKGCTATGDSLLILCEPIGRLFFHAWCFYCLQCGFKLLQFLLLICDS